MNYIKTTIKIFPIEEWIRDVIAAQLAEIGFESFAETENGLEAFIPTGKLNEKEFLAVLNEYAGQFAFDAEHETIKDQNWNEVWERNYFKPLIVADICVVRAPFHTDFPNAEYEIVIEPNMAFGTGNHETTSMMLEYILENDFQNKTVLDMGCGTGILGILASMKGAKKITAIDIDEWSYNGTKENSQLNQIQNIEVQLGNASLLGEETFDFIFANIQRNVLLQDIPSYSAVLNQNGLLAVSGFYIEDLPDIKAKALEIGLAYFEHKEKNKWVAATFKKK